MTSLAVGIGRFQPFHSGHFAALQDALQTFDQVVIGIGSAHRARTPRNPFTWQERAEMIRSAFTAHENARLHLLPLRDYFDVQRWSQAVFHQINDLARDLFGPSQPRICVVSQTCWLSHGEADDWEGWVQQPMPRYGEFNGSAMRETLFRSLHEASRGELTAAAVEEALESIVTEVPKPVMQTMLQTVPLSAWSYLVGEWHRLQQIRQPWLLAPFPPTFVTVDAVVLCSQHVLLIRRGGPPGLGLWALPGGFVEQQEMIRHAAMRELFEETRIGVSQEELRQGLVASRPFDHPSRSLFGRVITHGHFFDLGHRALPSVVADDDAQAAQWVPTAELLGLEDQFHDDHFFILDHFLKLL